MSNNSRKIDYRLRVAKAVERKMFCSAFQKLSVFYPLESYRYIGFGALYFADFYLIHRLLGIKNMISLEKSRALNTIARYQFNKPFDCIDIKFNASNHILPQLDWDEPTIIWLDYTSILNTDVLSDIDTVLRNAPSGSFLAISVNADAENFDPEDLPNQPLTRLDILSESVGQNKIPREIELNQISNKNLASVYTKIINKEVEAIMTERNLGTELETYKFFQIFNFKYKDGKPMYTFGGLITGSDEHENLFRKVQFDKLPFVRTDEESFVIDIPNLTVKEIKFLESLLPNGINEKGEILDVNNLNHVNPEIPPKDIKKFAKIYQYFPTFAETNLG